MSKTIMLFSRDPGGANTVIPLALPLKEKGYRIKLFGKDAALMKYAERGIQNFADITKHVKDNTQDGIRIFVQKEKPNFIITGTSADDMTEKYLWTAAEEFSIPCFAILDQWMNFGVRFSPYGVSELRAYNADRSHPYLPMKIVVMDDYARTEMVREGIPESRILVCGQPHFEFLVRQRHSEDGSRLRQSLGIPEADFVLTFASEPISRAYRETDESEHYWGYTEITIFRDLLKALSAIVLDTQKKVWVLVRPHPRENAASFEDFLRLQHPHITIIRDADSAPWDLIDASQLICGMSSMFLIESVIFGKPVLSVQIGLKREDPFILSRRGIVRSINDEKTLFQELKSLIVHNSSPVYDFPVIKEPVENIIGSMENYLCQG